jgi:hypothetical protein
VLYRWTRDLHLYIGLFVSPFLLLFAISVFVLNHAKVTPGQWLERRTVQDLQVPAGVDRVQGRDAIAAGRAILKPLGIDGEIDSARFVRQTGHFVVAVSKPGREVRVDVDVNQRTATVSKRPMSFWERLAYLHKMPGPHNVDIRGNWAPTTAWRAAADATIYITLFISISGIYLWWALRAERRIGLAVLSLGVVTLLGCLNALLH